MPATWFDPALSDEERRGSLYAGDIIVLSPTEASLALVELARKMLTEAFSPHDPQFVHKTWPAEKVAEVLGVMKPQFIHHPECKALIFQLMRERGVDIDRLYFDVPRLRSAYPREYLTSGIAYAFHPHRDTWYSAPQCQLNWWIPVYEIKPGNAMAFYPNYFNRPVANNSEIYNYYDWNTKYRAGAARHIKNDLREQPKPLQSLDQQKISFLPPPGGVIIFSGAQLHETVPNDTGIARYSIDFRTVHLDDVKAKRGARNVDSRSTGTTMRDYLRASDLQHLPESLIALYDDESAAGDKILHYGESSLRASEETSST